MLQGERLGLQRVISIQHEPGDANRTLLDQGITRLRQKRSIQTRRQSQPDSLGMARFRVTTAGREDITCRERTGSADWGIRCGCGWLRTVVLHGFFFDGCFWHSCELCQGDPSPTKRAKLESFFDTTAEDIRRYDDMVKDYVAGYCQEVVTMRECEWNALKSVPDTPQYEYVAKMKSNTRADTCEGPTSEHDLIQEIREGRIFGAALVDITTPDVSAICHPSSSMPT